jgi:hypothetical protein
MPWNPGDSQLKARSFEIFIEHGELRPDEWAVLLDFRPIRAAWSYLKRHHRRGLLRRHRDRSGRLVYIISSRGARWLLWWKAQGFRVKVRST